MREGELQHPGGDVLRAPPWRAPPGGFSCLAQGMGLCRRDLGFRFGDLRFGIWDWGFGMWGLWCILLHTWTVL